MENNERIEKLLMLILWALMSEKSNNSKIIEYFNRAGITNVEIADILGISRENVATVLYRGRKGRRGRK